MNQAVQPLYRKYQVTAHFYDILDYPWERQYRRWRPSLLADVRGKVLEAGVGTGRNLPYYRPGAEVTGIDLSPAMLRIARRRADRAACPVTLMGADATRLEGLPGGHFDWYIATFLYCVMPDELQRAALGQMARVLKPGGRFKIVEIVYSQVPRLRRRQAWMAPWVERVYGARFDRHTREHIERDGRLRITRTRFLKADTYLLIEGCRRAVPM